MEVRLIKTRFADLWTQYSYLFYVVDGRKIWHTARLNIGRQVHYILHRSVAQQNLFKLRKIWGAEILPEKLLFGEDSGQESIKCDLRDYMPGIAQTSRCHSVSNP